MANTFAGQPEAKVFLAGLHTVFWNTVKSIESKIGIAYRVSTSSQYKEELYSYAGLTDMEQWEESVSLDYEDIEGRYLSTLTHVDYGKGVRFGKKMKREARYNIVKDGVAQLAIAAMSKREALAASLFNNGFTTAWNATEGQYFFDDDHPMSGRSSTSTDSNLTSGALSLSNLETAITMLRTTLDDMGRPMRIKPIRLWIPPALEFTAKRILGSPDDPTTANRSINPVQRLNIQLVVWHDLTSTTAWFLQGDYQRCHWFDRVPLRAVMSEVDFDTEDTKYKSAFVAINGAADWRGWVGSLGT